MAPSVPGGIVPPHKSPSHAQQTRIAGGQPGQYAAVCDEPRCTFSGEIRDSYDAAEEDRREHVVRGRWTPEEIAAIRSRATTLAAEIEPYLD